MKKTAYMATFPPRIACLKKAVLSLCNQVDELHVVCNDYARVHFDMISDLMKLPNVYFYDAANDIGQDVGAIGKVYFCEDWSGYVFTVDDDFVYPPDYVSKTVEQIDKYERKAVVTYHGQSNKVPCKSYYNEVLFRHAVIRKLGSDVQCQIPGTGVMAFHTDAFAGNRITLADFYFTNMLDLLFGIACRRRGVPCIILAHSPFWIQVCPGFRDPKQSIWLQNRNDDNLQTEIFNAAKFEMQ